MWYALKALVFRGVPFPIIAWLQVLVPFNLRLLQKGSLIFRPTPFFFCSSLCIQYNTRRRKSTKSGEGLGTLVTRMMSGRRKVDVEGGGCPTTNSCVIYHRVSFLPVKSSIVDLVNIWALGYRWSAWWWSLVRYLNVDPSSPMPTSLPPDVTGVPRPSRTFASSLSACLGVTSERGFLFIKRSR